MENMYKIVYNEFVGGHNVQNISAYVKKTDKNARDRAGLEEDKNYEIVQKSDGYDDGIYYGVLHGRMRRKRQRKHIRHK